MSEGEPVIKRRRNTYGPDGMKLLSQRTIRRRRAALQRQLTEERRRLACGDENPRRKRLWEDVEPNAQPAQPCSSGLNQRVRQYTQNMHSSSDSDTPGTTADATVQANECQRVALHQLYLHNEDSITSGMSIPSDEILNCDDATATSTAESQHDDNVPSSVVDDSASSMDLQSSSPALTEHGASSPIEADFDRNNYTADKVRAYLHSVTCQTVMFPQSNMRCWQVVLVVLGLCIRFALNKKARRGVIDAIKLFAGPQFNNWDITDYYLSKIFDPPDEATLYHFYCELCFKELEMAVFRKRFRNHATMCQKCSKRYELTLDAQNSFVSLDLEYQITSLLRLKVVNEDLSTNLLSLDPEVLRSPDCIRDVYDGSLYKRLLAGTPRNSRLLTCSFNTDGAPIFNSSKRAFWPVIVIINELSPRVRFRYPLLAGMSIVRKEPSPELMNTFMRPFVKALQKLSTIGFYAQVGEEMVHFVLKPLFCGVDSVARPLLQNRLQFNGYYGCSWCYSKGQHINGCMRFLMEEPDPIERTHSDYLADVRTAEKMNRQTTGKARKKCTVRGVRGNSVLTLWESWNMIWGFSRDYLHGDLLGATLQLINMFNDTNCPIRLTKVQMDIINERLMRMTPPHEVHRLVRPLKTERCKWKAAEWRSWLLFYAIPCSRGILDSYALQHFALYVSGIFTLLQTSITDTELNRVQYDLERFVIIFEVLYGSRYVTFNVHTVRHAVQNVRTCGPLWATSAFPFESTLHNLKKFVQGSRGISEQMTKKTIQQNVYRGLLGEADASPACLAFHRSLFGRTEVASYTRTDEGSIVFLGNGVPYSGAAPQFHNIPQHEIRAFKRCISSGIVVHSAANDKTTLKSDDTVFRTDKGTFVQVLHLVEVRGMALAEVVRYKVEQVIIRNVQSTNNLPNIGDVTIHHLVRVVDDLGTRVIRVEKLIEKCVVIKVNEQTYFSRMPNTIEIQ